MNQVRLKAEYERTHSTESGARIEREAKMKFACIVDGAKPEEIICMKNEKTGECIYTYRKI